MNSIDKQSNQKIVEEVFSEVSEAQQTVWLMENEMHQQKKQDVDGQFQSQFYLIKTSLNTFNRIKHFLIDHMDPTDMSLKFANDLMKDNYFF